MVSTECAGAVEQFLYREARLLDERRWEDWLALWADDGHLAVPTRSIVPSGSEQPVDAELAHDDAVWWFDEPVRALHTRVAKLRTGKAWAESPPSRTRRFVCNVEVEGTDQELELQIRSNLFLYRSRDARDVELHAGSRVDRIRRVDGGFLLVRRVVMLDSVVLDAPDLSVFL